MVADKPKITEDQMHQYFAVKLNGATWDLLGKAERDPLDDEMMIHAAHGSCFHWLQAGTPLHHQRGEWLIARVYSELKMPESAMLHAKKCAELTEKHPELVQDFDIAYSYEALARAHALVGNRDYAKKYRHLALDQGETIEDAESKEIFMNDLNGGNWHGLRGD